MSQRLSLPFADTIFNAGYLSSKYQQEWGFKHYGVDVKSESGYTSIKSMGDGVVHSCGQDGATLTGSSARCGNAVVIIYKDVEMNNGKKTDLACRLFHLNSITVKKGQTIKRGDEIGRYGNTGAYTSGAHLHVEFDTDASQAYAAWSPSVKSNGNIIKAGYADTCVDPSLVWFVGEGQSIKPNASGWYEDKDVNIPSIDEGLTKPTDGDEELLARIKELEEENANWKAQYDDLSNSFDELDKKYDELLKNLSELVEKYGG